MKNMETTKLTSLIFKELLMLLKKNKNKLTHKYSILEEDRVNLLKK